MAIVYRITCISTGKIYVGWTKLTMAKRWKRHCICDKDNCYFQNCIKKYGPKNFKIEVIFEYEKESDAIKKEIELIALWGINKSRFPEGMGMNMTDGGEGTFGCKNSEYQKDKIRKSLKGIKRSPKTIEKMRLAKIGEKNPMFGKPSSRRLPPKEKIKKPKNAKRRPRTLEEKKKLRKAQLIWLSQHPHPSLGNKRSKESCEKMRQSRLAFLQKQKGTQNG